MYTFRWAYGVFLFDTDIYVINIVLAYNIKLYTMFEIRYLFKEKLFSLYYLKYYSFKCLSTKDIRF